MQQLAQADAGSGDLTVVDCKGITDRLAVHGKSKQTGIGFAGTLLAEGPARRQHRLDPVIALGQARELRKTVSVCGHGSHGFSAFGQQAHGYAGYRLFLIARKAVAVLVMIGINADASVSAGKRVPFRFRSRSQHRRVKRRQGRRSHRAGRNSRVGLLFLVPGFRTGLFPVFVFRVSFFGIVFILYGYRGRFSRGCRRAGSLLQQVHNHGNRGRSARFRINLAVRLGQVPVR